MYCTIIPTNSYLTAKRCCLILLKNQSLFDAMLKLSVESCFLRKVSDVEITISYLESFFEELKIKDLPSHYNRFIEIMNNYYDDLESGIRNYNEEDKKIEFLAGLCDISSYSFPFYLVTTKHEIYPRCFDFDKAVEWCMSLLDDDENSAKLKITKLCESNLCGTVITDENPPVKVYYLKEHKLHFKHRFRFLDEDKCSLPKSFNFTYFLNIIDKLLSQDHYQILIRVVTFLYKTIDFFHSSMRVQLLGDMLLEKHFWNLFSHWYFLVRESFIKFLVYKAFRTKRTALPCLTPRINIIIIRTNY